MPIQYHPKSAQHNSLIAKIVELTKRNSMLTESNEALAISEQRRTKRNARLTKSNEAFAMSEHHREALGFQPESMIADRVATLAVMNITF